MSSFNLYDILPDKSKEALQSLFKSEEVVQTKPKPQSKIKKASPTPVAKKKLSKTPQSFRPTKGGHRNMRETLNSEHVPESLQQLYIEPCAGADRAASKEKEEAQEVLRLCRKYV